jgi:hypothetical protein
MNDTEHDVIEMHDVIAFVKKVLGVSRPMSEIQMGRRDPRGRATAPSVTNSTDCLTMKEDCGASQHDERILYRRAIDGLTDEDVGNAWLKRASCYLSTRTLVYVKQICF